MNTRGWLVAVSLIAGCATTGDVTVRVPAPDAARVPTTVVAVATARATAAEAAQAFGAARAEWSRAVDAARAVHPAAATTPELGAVGEAQRRHSAATVAWRAGVVEMMRWRLAAAQAHVELEIAMFLARTGAELDLGSFQRQQAQLQHRHATAERQVIALHADMDAAMRALAQAKERYAASRRGAPPLLVTTAAPEASR